jgi:hypothetical protein
VNGWIIFGIVVVACVAIFVANRLGWIDLSNKNESGPRGGVMGIGDEVFNPTRHEAQIEMDRQTVLPAPSPIPGDGDKGIYGGKVEIDLERPAEIAAGAPRGRHAMRDTES